VNPIALEAIKWKCLLAMKTMTIQRYANLATDYIVYDVWLFVELVVVYFLFIETRGSSLEEIALMIDGPDMSAKMMENVEMATVQTLHDKEDVGTAHEKVERV
jgi:hypothetical protein